MHTLQTTLKSILLVAFVLIITLNTNASAQNERSTSFSSVSNNAIEPINFVTFNANVNAASKNIVLNFVSSEEANTTPIEIQRSFNGKDFKNIGLVLDGFSKGTQMEYAFKDNSPLLLQNNTVFYRLKQVGLEGVTYFSVVIMKQLNGDCK